jgi:PAS domain S-box-containing protein
MVLRRDNRHDGNLLFELVALACLILAGMGTYEFLRPFIFHDVVSWEADHIVTIFLATSIAIAIAYTYLARHRESEERYRIAIENSNDGVVIVRDDGYLYVNQRFLDMFGYDSREEVMGKPLTINVDPDARELVSTTYKKRQKGELVPVKYEFKGIKKNGERLSIEVSVTRITYHRRPASLAYMRDITDRAKMEKERLHQAKLESALEMAGAVCHELNQPLQIVSGCAEILMMGNIKEDQVRKLDTIKEQTHRMGMITKKLMGFKEYSTRDYIGTTKIIDIDGEPKGNNPETKN